jgi:hypothetical protein
MKNYSHKIVHDALGVRHEFIGPGMYDVLSGVHLMQLMNEWASKSINDDLNSHCAFEADVIKKMLEAAYEAGKDDVKKELRQALGIKK